MCRHYDLAIIGGGPTGLAAAIYAMTASGGKLASVVAVDKDGTESTFTPAAAFVFIGLDPNTGWLGETVELDSWKFVRTDMGFQTSMPGVFAAGDVRSGSTKQLGSAVGDGIAALIAIRAYLQEHSDLRNIDVNA